MRLTQTAIALALALIAPLPVLAQEEPEQDAPAVVLDAGDAGAYLAAMIAGADRNYREAAGWYTRALLADPKNPVLLEGALIANISLGNFDAATQLAKALDAVGVTSQSAILAHLADEAGRGDYAAILDALQQGRSIGVLVDGLVAAWAEAGNGRMTEALQAFDKIATAKGLETFGLYHKALALAQVGDFEGAQKILSGEAAGPVQMLRRGVVAHAQILSQLERNAEAITLLDRVSAPGQDPGIDRLREQLRAGETVPFDVATTPQHGIAEVFYTLATALNGQAEHGYTLLHSRIASHLRPDHTEALLMSAEMLEADGQYDIAVETYAQVAEDDPSFHIAEIGRANALYAVERKDAAIEALQALARSHGTLVPVQMALGDMLRRSERFDEASQAYDAALSLIASPGPAHWALFYARGICHEREKRWDLAEADFRKSLELSPDQPQVLNYLGYSFIDRNINLDEALSMIQRAVAAEPDSGYILDSLAWGYYRLGRFAEALVPMEQASLLEPVDPIVTDHLGDVYWAVGRKLEAQFQWRRALSFDPEEKEATRIRRKLEVGLDAVLAEEGAKPLNPVDAAASE